MDKREIKKILSSGDRDKITKALKEYWSKKTDDFDKTVEDLFT